jgi:hypothetical protein
MAACPGRKEDLKAAESLRSPAVGSTEPTVFNLLSDLLGVPRIDPGPRVDISAFRCEEFQSTSQFHHGES